MQQRKRKHYRVALKDVHETPAKGIYVTEQETKQLLLYSVALFIVLSILALLRRNR